MEEDNQIQSQDEFSNMIVEQNYTISYFDFFFIKFCKEPSRFNLKYSLLILFSFLIWLGSLLLYIQNSTINYFTFSWQYFALLVYEIVPPVLQLMLYFLEGLILLFSLVFVHPYEFCEYDTSNVSILNQLLLNTLGLVFVFLLNICFFHKLKEKIRKMWKDFGENLLLPEIEKKIIKLELKVELIINLLIILITLPLLILGIYLKINFLVYFGIKMILITLYQLFTLNVYNRELLQIISCNLSVSLFYKQLMWLCLLSIIYLSILAGLIDNKKNFKQSEEVYCEFDINQIVWQISVGEIAAFALFIIFPLPFKVKYSN